MGFLEIDRKSISLLVAGRVQEYGFLPGVGALPCFEYALTKAGGGLRHADENHWLRQFWEFGGQGAHVRLPSPSVSLEGVCRGRGIGTKRLVLGYFL